MLKKNIATLSLFIFANLFLKINSLQAMDPKTPKVYLISRPNLMGYYYCDKGITKTAAQIMPGNTQATFDPDSFIAMQEQQGKIKLLKDPQAIYNQLKALYIKQQQTAKL